MKDALNADVDAALARIGVEAEPPSIDALFRIHRAYVETVPYETVWIHMDERWSIDPANSVRRIARQRRGGYCFHLNGALSVVLRELGYHVTRHIGGVHGHGGPELDALTNHLVLVVHDLPTDDHPDGRWYADAGLGDGLHEPMPLRSGTCEQGPLRFILEATDDCIGDWHFVHDPTGSFAGMSFGEAEVGMDAFARRHEFLSTSPESSFAGTVTAQLRLADGTDILRGLVLTRRRGQHTTTETFEDRADWFALLADAFGISPAGPIVRLDALWARVTAAHEAWLAGGA